MSNVFIWIYSDEGGAKFMKHFKGSRRYKSLGISGLSDQGLLLRPSGHWDRPLSLVTSPWQAILIGHL
jgi:hypothetical protein